MFVTMEGIDGAGKSSHVQAVARQLASSGREVVVTREPGGTPLAESIRGLVLTQPMDALTEVLLVFAARRDHVQSVIRPALARGAIVLSDRFTDSTFAYQGAGRGFDEERLSAMEAWVQEGLQPDLTVWFDVEPAVAAGRLVEARKTDKFEREAQAFFETVRAGYARRAAAGGSRFERVDAGEPLEAVSRAVATILRRRLLWAPPRQV